MRYKKVLCIFLHPCQKSFQMQKLFFHLKALQTRMQIDVNNFFIAQVVPEISAKKHKFQNQLDVYFWNFVRTVYFDWACMILSWLWFERSSSAFFAVFVFLYQCHLVEYKTTLRIKTNFETTQKDFWNVYKAANACQTQSQFGFLKRMTQRNK